MLNRVLGWMSPNGSRARLSVLIFHRVLPAQDPLFPDEVDADRFNEICGWLKDWFNILPLDEAIARLKAGTLPTRAACITFDDGYADNCQIALPILQKHGLTAAFFIATGYLNGGRMWNDTVIEAVRRTALDEFPLHDLLGSSFANVRVNSVEEKRSAIAALIDRIKYEPVAQRDELTGRLAQVARVSPPVDLMMTSDQLRAMRLTGMVIGAHTVSHPILAKLDRATARAEIAQGKLFLEDVLGERIGLFAYPNGRPQVDYTEESVAVVRELGFDAALSTRWAASSSSTDMFQIPRFTPWDRARLKFGGRMAANLLRQ
jgi:peptidoglycan/xylan/chitin deacetylase (PgdA/CDA1 family)